MFRRSLVLVVAAVFVAALAMLPELANPASGSPAVTRAGQVFPTSLTAGGTTRFCGAGFVADAPIEVLVGGQAAQTARTDAGGAFCVFMRANPDAQGSSQLLAIGRAREGGILNVTGGVAIAGSEVLRRAAETSVGPLISSDAPLVIELWAAVAVAGLLFGLWSISRQRRRSGGVGPRGAHPAE